MVKIFVGRLNEEVTKEELEELFKAFGEVTDCSVLKNYGFVHMADLDEAKAAIAGLDKFELRGGAINVELSTTKVAKACKLFVGKLPAGTKSSEIHKIFKPFGTVIECDVVKNYAFVHMGKESQARDAISALNNSDFNGSKISVEMAKPKRNERGFDGYGQGGDMWGMRGRGRGYLGMPPMRGMPRFRGRPFMQDPFMGRGGMRPRMPMRGRGAAGLGSMYDNDMLSARAQGQMLYGAGDALTLRDREAILARRLEAADSYGLGSSDYDFSADMGMGGYGNGAGGFGINYHAY